MSLKADMLAASAAAAQNLSDLATNVLVITNGIRQTHATATRPDDVANALDLERVANAVVGRIRGLNLDFVLDLASSQRKLDAAWNADLNAKITALVP